MSHKRLKQYILSAGFLILSLAFMQAAAQQTAVYPVQLNVQLLPPYTPCLADYVTGDFSRLRVVALQRDMSKPDYRFSLKMTILSGTSVVLQSRVTAVNYGNDFEVRPGMAVTLTGEMLQGLFNPKALSRMPSDYEKNGHCLPEGAYELVFQAYDAAGRTPISEPASTFIYLSQDSPPYLIAPENGSCLSDNTQTVTFSWVDGTASFRNDKRYDIEIYESEPGTTSVQNIFMNNRPVVRQTGLTVPFLQMPVTAGKFINGKRYAWRVQVYNANTTGSTTGGAYVNKGFSEMFYFDFNKCADPFEPVKTAALTNDKPLLIRIRTDDYSAYAVWQDENKYESYRIEYHRKGSEGEWMNRPADGENPDPAKEDSLQLTQITRGVTYEVRLQGKLRSGENRLSQYSDVLEFTLPEEESINCGDPIPALTSTMPVENLSAGDKINADGYTVEITQVKKNYDGTFSGYGVVNSPLLLSALKLKVKFDGITVNGNLELQKGQIVTVYRESTSATLDLNGVLNKGATGQTLDEQAATLPVRNDVRDGGRLSDPSTFNTIVKDPDGNVYAIDDQGKVAQIGKINPAIKYEENSLSTSKGKVTFDILDGQGMIIDKDAGCFSNYVSATNFYEKLSDSYPVAWMPLPSGSHKKIQAKIENLNSYKADSIKFICSGNVVLNSTYKGNNLFEVNVFGGDAETSQAVYAIVREQPGSNNYLSLGKLSLAHYEPLTRNIVLVPVGRGKGSIDGTAIEDTLNKIYRPIGITIKVSIDERIDNGTDDPDFAFLSDGLNVGDTKTWTNETDEMKRLQALYKQKRTVDNHTAYLFVLQKAQTTDNNDPITIQGDMPRGKQAGYLFAGNPKSTFSDGRLVAHELGHGMFNLEHTEVYGGDMKTCDNLMSYKPDEPNTHTTVWQWDRMYHPGIVWNFLEGDEDGMMSVGKVTEAPDGVPAYALYLNDTDFNYLKTKTVDNQDGTSTYFFKDGSSFTGFGTVRLQLSEGVVETFILTNCPVYCKRDGNGGGCSFTNPNPKSKINNYYKSYNTNRGNLIFITGIYTPSGKEAFAMTLPNGGTFDLTVNTKGLNTPRTFNIVDASGNQVATFSNNNGKDIVNQSITLPGGIYKIINVLTPGSDPGSKENTDNAGTYSINFSFSAPAQGRSYVLIPNGNVTVTPGEDDCGNGIGNMSITPNDNNNGDNNRDNTNKNDQTIPDNPVIPNDLTNNDDCGDFSFQLDKLTATDSDNNKRVAKAGETLYYVNKPTINDETRNTEFKMTYTPSSVALSEINDKILWDYSYDGKMFTEVGSVTKKKKIKEKKDATMSVKAGCPTYDTKSVYVKWIDESSVTQDLTFNLDKIFKGFDFLRELANLSKGKPGFYFVFEPIKKTDKTFLLQWGNSTYRDEDDQSRHVLGHDELIIRMNTPNFLTVKAGYKCDIVIPWTSKKVDLLDLYLGITIGADVRIEQDDVSYYENKKVKEQKKEQSGGFSIEGKVCVEAGVGIVDEKEKELAFGIQASGCVQMEAGIRLTNELKLIGIVKPLVFQPTLKAKLYFWESSIDIPPFVLWDIEKKVEIFDFSEF